MYIIVPKIHNVLFDQDGVLADLYYRAYKTLKERHPDFILKDRTEQRDHYISREYPQYAEEIYAIYKEKGFFRNLPPIEGGIEAILKIAKKHRVALCTSPLSFSEYCVPEKEAWKEELLGKRIPIFFTGDKTYYRARFIIDDNPNMEGDLISTNPWEHVIFDAPYNQQITDKRRITWKNYEEVLYELL